MPRIRSIKPQLPQDVKLAKLARVVRLHFVYLFTVADDEGYFRASPRLLLGQLYPHDRDIGEAAVDAMTAELAPQFVEIRHGEDGPIGHIRKWSAHQKIDHPTTSFLAPLFSKAARIVREEVATRSQESLSLEITTSSPPAPAPEGEPKKRKAKAPPETPDPVWEECKVAYPKRAGGYAWVKALAAWGARKLEGEDPQVMLAGTKGYARDVRAREKDGTEFVVMPPTFYGPQKRYLEFLPPPKPARPALVELPEGHVPERIVPPGEVDAALADMRKLRPASAGQAA